MKLIICTLACILSFNLTQAQESEELTIAIGDTIMFKTSCDSGTFNYIDLYTKTRYYDTIVNYDTITGDGFYKSFFFDGDFGAERLPCSYNGQKFTINSAQYFEDNNTKEERLIVFVRLESWDKVAWVELIDAYEGGEILLEGSK